MDVASKDDVTQILEKKPESLIARKYPDPKTSPASEMPGASSKKILNSINPEEPWTGRWEVLWGSRKGKWSLKQVASKVVSTGNSVSEIEGLASGDQLKGKITRMDHKYPFTLKMSSDGQSFNGTTTDYLGRITIRLKGERKE